MNQIICIKISVTSSEPEICLNYQQQQILIHHVEKNTFLSVLFLENGVNLWSCEETTQE